jgi:hypothetical protein
MVRASNKAWTPPVNDYTLSTLEEEYILEKGADAKTGLSFCLTEFKHQYWFYSIGTFLGLISKPM